MSFTNWLGFISNVGTEKLVFSSKVCIEKYTVCSYLSQQVPGGYKAERKNLHLAFLCISHRSSLHEYLLHDGSPPTNWEYGLFVHSHRDIGNPLFFLNKKCFFSSNFSLLDKHLWAVYVKSGQYENSRMMQCPWRPVWEKNKKQPTHQPTKQTIKKNSCLLRPVCASS